MEVATPISGLFSRVYREILADKTQLPSMPDVALRIRAAMQQPNYTVQTVSRVVKADPGTSAYLISIANSALYAAVSPIQKIEQAISRLGTETARNLVTAYALRAMFTTRSPVLARIMQVTWRRSVKLAALSAVIAKRCPGFTPDESMLAGLLQDIGVLPLLHALDNTQHDLTDPARVYTSIEAFSCKVGPVLLRHWNFDDETIEVARSKNDWLRDTQPTADLADLILVARLYTYAGHENINRLPCINELPAFKKLPLDKVGPDANLAFLNEADDEVRDIMRMLGV